MLANRINRVTVRNFRSLGDVTVDLEDLTVLVGLNGSGKSNFLDALQFLSDAMQYGLDTALRNQARGEIANARGILSSIWGLEITVDATLEGKNAVYTVELEIRRSGYHHPIMRESCSLEGHQFFDVRDGKLIEANTPILNQGLVVSDRNLTLPLVGNLPEIRPLYESLKGIRIYSIFPIQRHLFPSQKVGTLPYPLDEHGENLLSALNHLINNSPWKRDFFDNLARVVPNIDSDHPIRVVPIGSYFAAQVKHKDGFNLDLIQESDGTLGLIALLTAIYQDPPLPFMGIEEPDLMLHPGAVGILSDIITEASHRGQIILTTHSPDLISRFKAESLRIVELVDGQTQIGPLREDQRQVINDQLFSGGDLLRIEGLRRG